MGLRDRWRPWFVVWQFTTSKMCIRFLRRRSFPQGAAQSGPRDSLCLTSYFRRDGPRRLSLFSCYQHQIRRTIARAPERRREIGCHARRCLFPWVTERAFKRYSGCTKTAPPCRGAVPKDAKRLAVQRSAVWTNRSPTPFSAAIERQARKKSSRASAGMASSGAVTVMRSSPWSTVTCAPRSPEKCWTFSIGDLRAMPASYLSVSGSSS